MSNWLEIKDNPRLKQAYDTRLKIIRLIRQFFEARGFAEVDTPIAVRCPDIEPHLNLVGAVLHDETGAAENFYLHTSPEYGMKKLLAAGYDKIFQISHCFRDFEESGDTHNPEFSMLEWYRAPGDYKEIMDDTQALFKFIGQALGKTKIGDKNQTDIAGEWERVSMKELWQRYLNVNLDEYLTENKIRALSGELGYVMSPKDDFCDLFFKIFLNKIEPHLGIERPTIVYNYPAQMAALARLSPTDSRYAQRFELYAGGLEVGNAFGELTDSGEQEARFLTEQAQRKQMGKPVPEIDKELINALKYVPTAAGIAVGVDRLAMLFAGVKSLKEVMFQTAREQKENS